jgi:hypothetical protein
MLRGQGAGEESGEKADESDEHDREGCRRPGAQLISGREVNENALKPFLAYSNALARITISTTIGARNRRPPTIVVRTN